MRNDQMFTRGETGMTESERSVSTGGEATDDEATVVVGRPIADRDDDETVVVESVGRRGRHATEAKQAEPEQNQKQEPGPRGAVSRNRARRTRIVLPAGREPSARAVVGPGPGAVQVYRPRQVPPPPEALPELVGGDEPTRLPAPSMPSVTRASQRMSVLALGCVLAACVVSVIGLIVIAGIAIG